MADIWEVAADVRGEHPAQVHGEQRVSWTTFDRRADGVATWLLDLGVERQDKVAQYLYNGPEYLQAVFGCFKAGLVPVNTNYRYTDDELAYLWDNADAVAVTFSGTFTPRIEAVRDRVPVRAWLWVDDGSGPCPPWATPFEEAAGSATERTAASWGRDGDDLYFIYTGGTTGMPKGVMWRQDDLVGILGTAAGGTFPAEGDVEALRTRITEAPPGVVLPAAPLMHGTGALATFSQLLSGATVVTLTAPSFDAVELLDAIAREKVNLIVIVGDAFSRPILDALDAEPDRWDLSSLVGVVSSGAMWSRPVKDRLLAHHPNMLLLDSLGSSEAVGMGASISAGTGSETATFALGENAVVLTEDGRPVAPGSGEVGRVGVRGRVPVGYYKDPEKSAQTFPVLDGVRYSMPGDYATVEADGTLSLLGRGSVCINTGGEKVFPEEVEEVLKTHATVRDAVAVGVPDERFGQIIVAVVEPEPSPGGGEIDPAAVIAHVKTKLASFKAPKQVVVVETIGRAPNGKVDYARLTTLAAERLAVRPS